MTTYGLTYPPSFIDSLPVLKDRPSPHTPIRALSTAQFAELHLNHLTAHAPDGVLFPFLHGLESENSAQNLFFGVGKNSAGGANLVPRFRGLVWVFCVGDTGKKGDNQEGDDGDNNNNDDDDGDAEENGDPSLEDDLTMDMDVDPISPTMHPVAHRKQLPPITTHFSPSVASWPSDGPKNSVSLLSSSASTATSFSTTDTAISDIPSPTSISTSATSLPTSCPSQSASPPSSAPLRKDKSSRTSSSLLTSTFFPCELLKLNLLNFELLPEFAPPKVPQGISLRNFGIQVPIYATISDIVIYSPRGLTPAALALAETFKCAIERKFSERASKLRGAGGHDHINGDKSSSESNADSLLKYNVFVLDADGDEVRRTLPHLVKRTKSEHHDTLGPLPANTVDFQRREMEEMRDLTRASEILSIFPPNSELTNGDPEAARRDPSVGQVFIGNANGVPESKSGYGYFASAKEGSEDDPFNYRTNDPAAGLGYDLIIYCADEGFPSQEELGDVERHINALEQEWAGRVARVGGPTVRPPPNASEVVHLRFPTSPMSTGDTRTMLMMYLRFLERMLQPVASKDSHPHAISDGAADSGSRRKSPSAMRSRSASLSSTSLLFPASRSVRTRPLKILLCSLDGYTESSIPALCLLMAVRGLRLPEAYLELQVAKRRSFFVHSPDVNLLRCVESWVLELEESARRGGIGSRGGTKLQLLRNGLVGMGRHSWVNKGSWDANERSSGGSGSTYADRTSALSTSSPGPASVLMGSRPRASTSPWLPSLFPDHQAWFDDPRFEGSFPSRVLDFLYLGNLNHASNVYMLHALGITHVVSVGECALVPPSGCPSSPSSSSPPGAHMHHKRASGQGSLWIEEREGRICVLDIKGVCDDGIDTLAPQLEPICNWIDRAWSGGGHVLVHCKVGVSRSATVVIAYVMKHLQIPLVDAYLIVRSRRLSVLIQPNMRLLYNLCGWEIKLAQERAKGDRERLRAELSRTLSWPYLAREVHSLNDKYL